MNQRIRVLQELGEGFERVVGVAPPDPGKRRRRSWPRSAAGGIPVLLAVGMSIIVAVFALVLIRHKQPNAPSNGPTGTPPASSGPPTPLHLSRTQRKEVIYLEKAQGTASRRDSACSPGPARGSTISQGSPSPALLSILGVLRRPATPVDRLPRRVVGVNHKVIPNGSLPSAQEIYVRYIRRARWRFGAGYYIVPAGNVNSTRPVPARCYAEQAAALRRELPQIPKALRAGTLRLEPRFVAQQRLDARPYAGVCLLALNNTGGGDVGCDGTIANLKQHGENGSGGPTGVGVVYGIIPDGVATLTLYYPAKGNHAHTRAITAKVISNVFIIRNPGQRLPNYGFPNKVVWRSANGTVIKTLRGF